MAGASAVCGIGGGGDTPWSSCAQESPPIQTLLLCRTAAARLPNALQQLRDGQFLDMVRLSGYAGFQTGGCQTGGCPRHHNREEFGCRRASSENKRLRAEADQRRGGPVKKLGETKVAQKKLGSRRCGLEKTLTSFTQPVRQSVSQPVSQSVSESLSHAVNSFVQSIFLSFFHFM